MRPDLSVVAAMIPRGSHVLDLGCGDGELLEHLMTSKDCNVLGVEFSAEGVRACLARGVPVLELDIDEGLGSFDDASFDVVVLSQTLQATYRPLLVVREMIRVGGKGIVSFPNFGHWKVRSRLALGGRMPSSRTLPYEWYETPNIHLCATKDFEAMATAESLRIRSRVLLNEDGGRAHPLARTFSNLWAAGAVYLVERRPSP